MKPKRKIISLLLCAAILLSFCPTSVFAEAAAQDGGVSIGASGFCEHHPEHTEDCGYTEGTPESPCTHEHTDECHTLIKNCVHSHTEDCYPAEGVSGNTATPSDADKAESVCGHVCSKESGCITKDLNCQHEHDSECGYAPATEGTPCGYVCKICKLQDSGHTSGQSVQKSEGDLATPSNAAQLSAGDVQKLIGELPTADELAAMTPEEQQAVYTKVQAAYEAYNALTDEQKAEVAGAEIFDGLFAVFNGMTNTLAEKIQYIVRSWNGSEVTEETRDISDYTEIMSTNLPTDWNTDNGGWYVVTGTVEIADRITVTGNVHLILKDNCTLTAAKGITVSEGNSLTIYAQSTGTDMGKLVANAVDECCAGIGGKYVENSSDGNGGTITINGGEVRATGAASAAGIGGGFGQVESAIIIINGGTVIANGGEGGAGIGGGMGGGGNITIRGGTVTATGGDYGAGIGCGEYASSGTITITGGDVTANGGSQGAGIGKGYRGDQFGGGSNNTIIIISGGTVKATGGDDSAGIGGGDYASGGIITITGGTVTATGGGWGAGIGGGDQGSGGTITISGGIVTANGSDNAAGIGGGHKGSGANIGADCDSFTTEGNAVIIVTSGNPMIADPDTTHADWQGIIIEGSTGQVYGDATPGGDFTIPNGTTVTVPEGSTLTIEEM